MNVRLVFPVPRSYIPYPVLCIPSPNFPSRSLPMPWEANNLSNSKLDSSLGSLPT